MRSPAYRLMFGAALTVLLAACTTASAPVASPTSVAEDRSAPTPLASAAVLQQTTAPPLLLVDLNHASPGQVSGLRMRPVDPATLADVPGIAPLDFAHHYVQTVSPDGRTMAAIIWPSGSSNAGGMLHLIDLPSWTDTTTRVTFDDYVAGLVFSPDGQALYWAASTRHDAAHGIGQEYALYRYDLTRGAPHEVTRFPSTFTPGFLPTSARFLRSGAQFAIYGVPTDTNNLAEDVPYVLIVDLVTERVAADVRLDGVKAGQFQENAPGTSGERYQMFTPGLAWDRTSDRLFVVHADVDAVTVVDLIGGVILARSAVQPQSSVLGRVTNWLMPSVAAKGGPTTSRTVALSNDGNRLYAIGQRTEIVKQPNGQARERTIPLGLQVIDTGNLTELRHLDLSANDMALSPDGQRLLVHTFHDDDTGTASTGSGAKHALVVLDAERLTERGQVGLNTAFSLAGFSPDGRFAYLYQSINTGTNRVFVKGFDLQTQRFAAERTLDGYFADLLASRGNTVN